MTPRPLEDKVIVIIGGTTGLGLSAAQACVRSSFDPETRMNPEKVLPSGAKCGDHAAIRGSDVREVVEGLPEGSWI